MTAKGLRMDSGMDSQMDSQMDAQERELWLRLYCTMVRVREFEHAARDNYQAGKLPGFLHLSRSGSGQRWRLRCPA
jgi:TPP-dependent pyruvate/acetoin dehydrogenase alpha subunit